MFPTDAVMERRILREQKIIITVAGLNASEEVAFLFSVEFRTVTTSSTVCQKTQIVCVLLRRKATTKP